MGKPEQHELRRGSVARVADRASAAVRCVWKRIVHFVAYLYAEPKVWLLEVGVAGYLAGMFLFPNSTFHGLWLLLGVAIPVWRWRTSELNARVYDDLGFWLFAGLLSWMLATSIFVSIPHISLGNVLLSLVDAAGILCLYAAVSIVVRDRFKSWRRLLTPFPIVGAMALLISIPIFYGLREANSFPTSRLRDVFVHIESGGLHQVLTGLLAGAAAMAAACLFTIEPIGRSRHLF